MQVSETFNTSIFQAEPTENTFILLNKVVSVQDNQSNPRGIFKIINNFKEEVYILIVILTKWEFRN